VDRIKALEEKIGYSFQDPNLLVSILVHPSYLKSKATSAFERGEFLGDRVLGLSIASLLCAQFPAEKEGRLAKKLSYLVCQETLALIAQRLDLGQYLTLSKGELKSGAMDNPSILADALEALLGALYLEGGFQVAYTVVQRLWAPLVSGLSEATWEDPKGQLQEWAQQQGLGLPQYITLGSEGPPHAPLFTVEGQCASLPPVKAQGPSKKIAEQEAASQLLTLISQRKNP